MPKNGTLQALFTVLFNRQKYTFFLTYPIFSTLFFLLCPIVYLFYLISKWLQQDIMYYSQIANTSGRSHKSPSRVSLSKPYVVSGGKKVGRKLLKMLNQKIINS